MSKNFILFFICVFLSILCVLKQLSQLFVKRVNSIEFEESSSEHLGTVRIGGGRSHASGQFCLNAVDVRGRIGQWAVTLAYVAAVVVVGGVGLGILGRGYRREAAFVEHRSEWNAPAYQRLHAIRARSVQGVNGARVHVWKRVRVELLWVERVAELDSILWVFLRNV